MIFEGLKRFNCQLLDVRLLSAQNLRQLKCFEFRFALKVNSFDWRKDWLVGKIYDVRNVIGGVVVS